ncbi:MAG: nitroreductase family protein, partial [Bacteroidales bacterium]|nr:nitroreductase family protein [Bacteroidales bacterium]
FKELLLRRQSDRKYEQRLVEREKVEACIEASRLSPSACNSQPWTFVVADEPLVVEKLQKAAANMGLNRFIHQVPVIVAVVLEKANLTASIGSVIKDKEYPLMDIGIAANNFCMQAAELGLGTCMIGWFDEKKVKEVLEIPSAKRVPLLIALGYSSATLREKTRKPMGRICKYNSYK